jgi:hypothetical protein
MYWNDWTKNMLKRTIIDTHDIRTYEKNLRYLINFDLCNVLWKEKKSYSDILDNLFKTQNVVYSSMTN